MVEIGMAKGWHRVSTSIGLKLPTGPSPGALRSRSKLVREGKCHGSCRRDGLYLVTVEALGRTENAGGSEEGENAHDESKPLLPPPPKIRRLHDSHSG